MITSKSGSMNLDELEATVKGDLPDGKEAERFEKFLNEPKLLSETEKDRKDQVISRIENSTCEHGVENCPLKHSEPTEPGYLWPAVVIVVVALFLLFKMNS